MGSSKRDRRIEQAGQIRLARVEALRALCAIGVATAHVWGYSRGWDFDAVYGNYWRRAVMGLGLAAVPIFFAASGYLLYLPFAKRDFADGQAISLKQYAFNRARRIFPLYWVGLIVVLLVFRGGGTWDQWWKFMTFSEGFYDTSKHPVNSAMWTIVVDLHFYILLPFIAWGIARVAKGSWTTGFVAIGLLCLASFGFWDYATHHFTAVRLWQHSFPASFMFMGAGMLLAMVKVAVDRGAVGWVRTPLGNSDVWLLAAAAIVAICIWRLDLTPIETVSSFLAVGACILPMRDGLLIRLLDWRPLAVMGLATYSVYVWQGPVISKFASFDWTPEGFFGVLAVSTPVIAALSIASYFLVERPFLRMRRQWAKSSAPKVDDRPPTQPSGPIAAGAAEPETRGSAASGSGAAAETATTP